MPFLNGRRVTLAEFREANPRAPSYRYLTDGRRIVGDPGDPWPESEAGEPVIPPRAGGVRSKRSEAASRAVIADAMGWTEDDGDLDIQIGTPDEDLDLLGNVIARPVEHEPVVNVVRAEVAERTPLLNAMKSNPKRRSQTYAGRRERHLKQIARREGISIADAARQHPPAGQRTPSGNVES